MAPAREFNVATLFRFLSVAEQVYCPEGRRGWNHRRQNRRGGFAGNEDEMRGDYQYDILRELRDQQVRFAPREKKIEQAARAEAFLDGLVDSRAYTYREVCFQITDFKPEFHAARSFAPELLRSDLLRLIEDLYAAARVDFSEPPEKVWTTEELCERFQVTPKTVYRWRKSVLVARRFFVQGRERIGFLDSSVRHFLERHADLVTRGGDFDRLSEKERTMIIRLARRLARSAGGPTEVARRLAEKTGRSIETIRYTLRNFDERNPDIAIFPSRKAPINDELRKVLYRRYRLGDTVEQLADRFRRTVSSVYRVVGQMRAARIADLPLNYIDNPEFTAPTPSREKLLLDETQFAGDATPVSTRHRHHSSAPDVPEFIELDDGLSDPDVIADESESPHDEDDDREIDDASDDDLVEPEESGLPPYLEGLYRIPLLSRERESHLFRKMNYLKCKAARLRASLDPDHPKSSLMTAIEQMYDEAIETKNKIVSANLRLVVSIAKRHIGSGINFFDLISDGNLALIKSVEKFDYARGNKFSTYATWAIVRCFARMIPDEKRHRGRYRSVEDELFDTTEDRRSNLAREEKAQMEREIQVERLLGELDEREQQIIMRRYGLGGSKTAQTLREVGTEMGVTKERVRQIESRALEKLRKVVEEEHLEIPEP